MEIYKIVMTRRSKDDLIDIGDYIAYTLLEPETARNFIRGLRKINEVQSSCQMWTVAHILLYFVFS